MGLMLIVICVFPLHAEATIENELYEVVLWIENEDFTDEQYSVGYGEVIHIDGEFTVSENQYYTNITLTDYSNAGTIILMDEQINITADASDTLSTINGASIGFIPYEYGIHYIELYIEDGTNEYYYYIEYEVIIGDAWANMRTCDEEDCGIGDDTAIFYRNETLWIDGNAGIYTSGVEDATVRVTFNKGGSYGITPVEIINEIVSFTNATESVCFLSFNGGLGSPIDLDFPPNEYTILCEIFKEDEMRTFHVLHYIEIVDHDYGGVETTLNSYNQSGGIQHYFDLDETIHIDGTITFSEDRSNIDIITTIYYYNNSSYELLEEIINTTMNFDADISVYQANDIEGSVIEIIGENEGTYYIETTITKDGTTIQEEREYFVVVDQQSPVMIRLQDVLLSIITLIILLIIFDKLFNNIKRYMGDK